MNIKQAILVALVCGVFIGFSGVADSIILGRPNVAEFQPSQVDGLRLAKSPEPPSSAQIAARGYSQERQGEAAADPEIWFQQLVTAYSSSSGGISLDEISVLADIARATSTAPQQRRFKRMVRDFARQTGGISLDDMTYIARILGDEADLQPRSYEGPPIKESPFSSYALSSSNSASTIAQPTPKDDLNRSSVRSRLGSIEAPKNAETIVLNPAGPNGYTGPKGEFYTRTSPNGVINSRTGEFVPIN